MKKIKVAPEVPGEVSIKETGKNRAEISAWAFEPGFAITLAHPLRRILLGSSIGYAPISLKIDGVLHEFDSVRGMKEDIAVFIINLKNIRFIIKEELDRAVVSYSFSGPREIKAGDLANEQVEVINGDDILATLNEDAELNFTIELAKGIGYIPSEDLRDVVDPKAIALDAFFTPVRKANYKIENVLVDDNPDYEKIIFEIETDGLIPIDMLGFSARSSNSLDRAGIKFIGELVLMSENEIKSIKNLGKKSLDEIMHTLESHGFGKDYELDGKLRADLIDRIKQLKNS